MVESCGFAVTLPLAFQLPLSLLGRLLGTMAWPGNKGSKDGDTQMSPLGHWLDYTSYNSFISET